MRNDGVSMKLNVGDIAPDFVLESHMEQKVRLSDLSRLGKITVIAFFPKAWTPI
jgi:peroxiredoxin